MSTEGKNVELSAQDKAGIELIRSLFGLVFIGQKVTTKEKSIIVHVNELTIEQMDFLVETWKQANKKFVITCKRSGTGITAIVDVSKL